MTGSNNFENTNHLVTSCLEAKGIHQKSSKSWNPPVIYKDLCLYLTFNLIYSGIAIFA
jgi:hypothetical protein